jgi:DNA-directed RNA polymerase subunit RPC12/RpoP
MSSLTIFQCPDCKRVLGIEDQPAPDKMSCPKCGWVITLLPEECTPQAKWEAANRVWAAWWRKRLAWGALIFLAVALAWLLRHSAD